MEYSTKFSEALERFIGKGRRREEHIRGSKKITRLIKLFQKLQEELSQEELNTVHRLMAAFLSSWRAEFFKKEGIQIFDSWDLNGPEVKRMGETQEAFVHHAPYHDHLYQTKNPQGHTIYHSEPYDLWYEGMQKLISLSDKGWDVIINGRGLHFPGDAVHIQLQRKIETKIKTNVEAL